jgi:hypothetical protein
VTIDEEKEWQALCESIATERDPDRMSILLARLIKEMDARRQALRNNGNKPPTGSGPDSAGP